LPEPLGFLKERLRQFLLLHLDLFSLGVQADHDLMRQNLGATLCIRDDAADTGAEPNVTTTVAWESPDVWVRRTSALD